MGRFNVTYLLDDIGSKSVITSPQRRRQWEKTTGGWWEERGGGVILETMRSPSSLEIDEFFTPMMTFARRLEKIVEVDVEDESGIWMRRTRSGKILGRRSLKLLEENDVMFYSPGKSFQE
ncbi:hypothetical protein LIER_09973 [Lithospermum erythrorhizon]|uniref:Uncharacterized protein n=1 Tax=Lithospermum erythrorhizon TaxID=34254 RepID=A0AAV3PIW6_LITER